MANIAIITITRASLQRCRFQWALKVGKKETWGDVKGDDPESAAATAINLAILHNDGIGYSIFAPKEVLDCIPIDLRNVRS